MYFSKLISTENCPLIFLDKSAVSRAQKCIEIKNYSANNGSENVHLSGLSSDPNHQSIIPWPRALFFCVFSLANDFQRKILSHEYTNALLMNCHFVTQPQSVLPVWCPTYLRNTWWKCRCVLSPTIYGCLVLSLRRISFQTFEEKTNEQTVLIVFRFFLLHFIYEARAPFTFFTLLYIILSVHFLFSVWVSAGPLHCLSIVPRMITMHRTQGNCMPEHNRIAMHAILAKKIFFFKHLSIEER